jgi:hypothetical protein
VIPNPKTFPIVRESHIFQRQQGATFRYQFLKIRLEIIVRTNDIENVLDAAQIGK